MSHRANEPAQNLQTTIYDCGGRGGINERWLCFPLDLNYVSFDPENDAFSQLQEIQQRYKKSNPTIQFNIENCALAEKHGTRKLNIYSSPDLSSFLKIDAEVTHRYRNHDIRLMEQVSVECDSLDCVSQRRQEQPDFLNIDTQGTEIFVLSGAERILKESVLGLRCEVEFVSLYERQPLFDQVWRFLSDRGFQLIRFDKTGSGDPGISTDAGPFSLSIEDAALAWADAIFFRKFETLNLEATVPEPAAERLLKYVLLTLVSDCGSIGLDLLWHLGQQNQLKALLKALKLDDREALVQSVLAYLDGVEITNWQTEPRYLKWYETARADLRSHLI